MKIYSVFLLLFFSFTVPNTLEQDKSYEFNEVLKNKNQDYFSLEKLNNITFKQLTNFQIDCVTSDYKIGNIYALNRLGVHYREEGKYKKALKYHSEALVICKKNSFIGPQMVTLNLAANVYKKQEDIKNALYNYQSVIFLYKQLETKSVNNKISLSVAENSLGNIYVALKQYKLGIKQFTKALKIQESTKNLRGLAINYQNIGEAYENLKLYNKATRNYKKSLTYNEKLKSDLSKVICKNGLASVSIKKGDYNKALAILEEIYPIAKKLKNEYYTAETLSNLGWVQLKLNDYKTSLINLNKALVITEKLGVRKLLHINIFNHLSELYLKKEDHERSYFYYKKAVEEEKKTIGQRNDIYISDLISKYELQSKTNAFSELQNETKIKSLQLERNKNVLIITLITIALLGSALYFLNRQNSLKNQQKILLLEQQALQSQMNPHFVFNALNSIKLYIINNEQKNAVYYLNKFSKLIRNILEVSKVKEVSLKEELSTMNLYMTIENIRFDNSIEYVEEIHPGLNTDTIKLPPLVLQPFIENSIWHGLSSKEGEKKIIISAKVKYKNVVEVNITDTGVGRKTAGDIKAKKSLKRKSVGVDLTKERLITHCKQFEDKFSLEYIDLEDKQGNPKGTTVCLQIPYAKK